MKVITKNPGEVAIIEVWDPAEWRSLLDPVQNVLGGPAEQFVFARAKNENWIGLCHEEGKLVGLPDNLTRPSGDMIVGPVVFLGVTPEGDWRGLSAHEIDAVEARVLERAGATLVREPVRYGGPG